MVMSDGAFLSERFLFIYLCAVVAVGEFCKCSFLELVRGHYGEEEEEEEEEEERRGRSRNGRKRKEGRKGGNPDERASERMKRN